MANSPMAAQDPIHRLLTRDPLLTPHEPVLRRRLQRIAEAAHWLTGGKARLADFASGHEFFGLRRDDDEWIFREWAPNATQIYLIGEMTGWEERSDFALRRRDEPDGTWELRMPGSAMRHNDLYRLRIHWSGGAGDRIPAYARRVVQDPHTAIFNAQAWDPPTPYAWQHPDFRPSAGPPFIYESHVGMARETEGVGSYREFADNVLPRIVEAGYNTVQLMAIQEHPYYGSFGYQVSNFFAASSRYGTPYELKELVDRAHGMGLRVVMDIVHSHAVANEVEGLSRFDGTLYQYFHDGPRGQHPAWDSRCFDYGKLQVLHFLLSNCRFWLDEYHMDGFRFDGVTSMLYMDHGLGKAFTSYDDYFNENVDEDALVYLALANQMIHDVKPDAMTIAEDISGMPGLAAPQARGGAGFDYRFAMGAPDIWTRLTREVPDEDWPIGHLWRELTNRRADEKSISYAESHDQALVGDQTLIFRLIGADMYDHMHVSRENLRVDRGMALHKMIRLLTLAAAGHGYLNFMGNEFGHPEWIDFPREGNNWSYFYARRQWRLAEDPDLRYRFLRMFDREMIAMARNSELLSVPVEGLLHEHTDNKVIAFMRAGKVFVFNFHPQDSYTDYRIDAPPGQYRMMLDTDAPRFGGFGRLAPEQGHVTLKDPDDPNRPVLSLYLPTRTGIVLEKS